jgi:CRISPR/Cas system CSM-associated protein Csm3 (group 7 of RAMP superfamily)
MFNSPFHCGTGLSEGLINRTVMRDRENYLYVPGSTIKGVLRETCEYLARIYGLSIRDPHDEESATTALTDGPDITEVIFGSRCWESTLFFDNAVMPSDMQNFFDSSTGKPGNKTYLFMQTEKRTQTAISRQTRTARQGSLYSSEFGISELYFDGNIHGHLKGIANELSEFPGPYSLFLLIAGLYGVERIGANRSTGMGRCRFSISELRVDDQSQNPENYCKEIDCLMCYETAKEEKTA